MRLRIWGCRGSVPTPGPETVDCGGNTSCVEVSLESGTALVLDAGTGIRRLGDELVERGAKQVHLLLTHLHLDHVEGLRFFAPLWDERIRVDIWGPPSPLLSLKERISRSFSPPLFPIDLGDVPALVHFHDVPRSKWTIDGAVLAAHLVVHPGPTVGYRIESGNASFAYLPDHEPALAGRFVERSTDWISGAAVAENVDLLLHDAQYSEDEYEARIGWGHSSVPDAVAFARAVKARRLLLFHHEPTHSDARLEDLEACAQSLAAGDKVPPTLAREGMVVELP
ncbi:MAG: MBL fold metallo-hydrolase [Gaiellaceae bacterium]